MHFIDKLTHFRQTELHPFPEISGEEVNTAAKVAAYLTKLSPDELITSLGGHGIIAVWKGKQSGKKILFRAELDALPIHEIGNIPHRSTINGKGHMCGHDGHSCILLGLAHSLADEPLEVGEVYLLFQPAEETGEGARAVLNDPNFPKITFDYVFALHNLPGIQMHKILYKTDTFTPAVCSQIIKLSGKTSHAAEPGKGINPATAVAELLFLANDLTLDDCHHDDFSLVVPVFVNIGSKDYGISAGEAEVHFTIRTWKQEDTDALKLKLENATKEICSKHSLSFEISYLQAFEANKNHEDAIALIARAAKNQNIEAEEVTHPMTWGEDFGLFTQKFKGAMFGLGSGENTAALHNPDYDFPDEIMATGIAIFNEIARNATNK